MSLYRDLFPLVTGLLHIIRSHLFSSVHRSFIVLLDPASPRPDFLLLFPDTTPHADAYDVPSILSGLLIFLRIREHTQGNITSSRLLWTLHANVYLRNISHLLSLIG